MLSLCVTPISPLFTCQVHFPKFSKFSQNFVASRVCCCLCLQRFLLLHHLFFQVMRPMKVILLPHFLQLATQLQDLLNITNRHLEFSFKSFEFVSEQHFFPLSDDTNIDRGNVLKNIINALLLHSYKISCISYLLLNQDVGDWVKARSTTWFSQFLMMQYNDKRWIEHSRVS